MPDQVQHHPKNAAGPFYVAHGCCASCSVPVTEAPDLFVYDADNHCYVRRQPSTDDELNRAFSAAWAAEFQCIRYRGNAPAILRRFAEAGLSDLCDIAPPAEIKPVFRNHVTFDALSNADFRLTALDLAEMFQAYLRTHDKSPPFHYRYTCMRGGFNDTSFAYAWYEENYHPLNFSSLGRPERRWLIHHSEVEKPGSRAVSLQLDSWLRDSGRFQFVRWYSADDWSAGTHGRELPQ